MKILEFGDRSKRILMLIHGFQSPWRVWEKYIERYKNDYHIIVPVLSGHDPESKEDFISFADDARAVEDYIHENYGEHVYAVFGMSMGGVLAATLWQNKCLKIDKLIFDGSPLCSLSAPVKRFMLRYYYNVTHKTQQRDKKTVDMALGMIITPETLDPFLIVLDNMSDRSIENCIEGIASFRLQKGINTSDTGIYYFHGTKANEALGKKTSKLIKRYYKNAVVKCFKGTSHCENSIFHPDIMSAELDKILAG